MLPLPGLLARAVTRPGAAFSCGPPRHHSIFIIRASACLLSCIIIIIITIIVIITTTAAASDLVVFDERPPVQDPAPGEAAGGAALRLRRVDPPLRQGLGVQPAAAPASNRGGN